MEQLIGSTFVNKNGPVDSSSIKESRVTCIYFCASWCPPCKVFTPILKEFYEDINCEIRQLEIVWVSSDKDEESFKSYLSEMPWLAIPFGDKRIKEILDHFRLEGIPTLYVIKPDGECVSTRGRQDVLEEGSDCFVKWVQLAEGKNIDKIKIAE